MTKSISFPSLAVSRYLITLKSKEIARLPVFLGSTLRGDFGHALKAAVCIVNHRDCSRCIVADRCVYPYLFETLANENNNQHGQQLPHPFVLAPPLLVGSKPGDYQQFKLEDELDFELTLMGRAIDYLPYIVYAISQMAEKGFGLQHRSSFKLSEVFCLDTQTPSKIYDSETEKLSTPTTTTTLANLVDARLESLSSLNLTELTLEITTPTRIRVDNDLQAELSFSLLIRNILRRVAMLSKHHGQHEWQPEFAALIQLAESVETYNSKIAWWDFERYSNRQQARMKLGGFIGQITYSGLALNALLPLIIAGEILHIGGNTSFGLGKYKIVK